MARQFGRTGERGAVVIHVALALLALLAFTVFVIDYGVMWVGRRQAQNAADAGALAGAVSLIRDEGTRERAIASAHAYAASNVIWGQANSAVNVEVTLSGPPPDADIPPCGDKPGCVRVDVFRDMPDRLGANRGDSLPVFFGPMLGITQQGVRATATAKTASGNSIKCLLPFAVIDRWADNYDENKDPTYFPWDPDPGTEGWSSNDMYQPTDGDVYVPPYDGNTNHTGWKVDADYGRQLILKDGDAQNYSAGWAMRVDLPDSTGSNDYNWNIENCNQQPVGIATEAEACPSVNEPEGCVSVFTGVGQGPTRRGIESVVADDPEAKWDPVTKTVVGGGGMSSPRIRPIVVVDINHYIAQGCSGTTCIAKVANIIGFFVEGMCNSQGLVLDNGMQCEDPSKDVVGRIITLPGTYVAGTGDVEESASFVKVVRLVR